MQPILFTLLASALFWLGFDTSGTYFQQMMLFTSGVFLCTAITIANVNDKE